MDTTWCRGDEVNTVLGSEDGDEERGGPVDEKGEAVRLRVAVRLWMRRSRSGLGRGVRVQRIRRVILTSVR